MQGPIISSATHCCTWLSWNQTSWATSPLLRLESIRGALASFIRLDKSASVSQGRLFRVSHAGGRSNPSGILLASGDAPTRIHRKRLCARPLRRRPQFNRVELLLLVLVGAIACALGAYLGILIGGLFLVSVLALRIAAFDFSWRGDAAMVVMIVSGLICMVLVVSSSLGQGL